jgi:hypothetical protein
MQEEPEATELRRRAVAYHEAGHAVMGYYFRRPLGPARLYIDTGQLRGEAKIYPGDRGEPYILAAGRACALSFGLPQERKDYAIDYEKLAEELSRSIPPDSDDDVFESREREVLETTARLFQLPDFRSAATAFAERLLVTDAIDDADEVVALISAHLTGPGLVPATAG